MTERAKPEDPGPGQAGQGTAPAVRTPWSWQPASEWRCPRCQTVVLSQELTVVCPACGLKDAQ